ncbi:hypothetical protein [Streptomyces spiramyceticus]|uniref:hypothetical protein n=1 Tax=Streptomyces spiramyceticus TaxID=299717 RepID=UPI00237B953A|nr:hypothetical protein [Streptomyces spiramyceticus]
MSRRRGPVHLTIPAHHTSDVILILLTRAPDEDELHAAHYLVDNAVTAAWALRPDALEPVSLDHYRQLLHYVAYADLLDVALFLRGDTKKIRTLMDHATQHMDDFTAIYLA